MARYFRVTTTTDIGFGKPGPEIFMHALDALGVPADAAVYVGDSLTWDVRGAGNAGMVSVWLNRNGNERTSDDRVSCRAARIGPPPVELALGKAHEAQHAPGSGS